jgi:hypothetical protein
MGNETQFKICNPETLGDNPYARDCGLEDTYEKGTEEMKKLQKWKLKIYKGKWLAINAI